RCCRSRSSGRCCSACSSTAPARRTRRCGTAPPTATAPPRPPPRRVSTPAKKDCAGRIAPACALFVSADRRTQRPRCIPPPPPSPPPPPNDGRKLFRRTLPPVGFQFGLIDRSCLGGLTGFVGRSGR